MNYLDQSEIDQILKMLIAGIESNQSFVTVDDDNLDKIFNFRVFRNDNEFMDYIENTTNDKNLDSADKLYEDRNTSNTYEVFAYNVVPYTIIKYFESNVSNIRLDSMIFMESVRFETLINSDEEIGLSNQPQFSGEDINLSISDCIFMKEVIIFNSCDNLEIYNCNIKGELAILDIYKSIELIETCFLKIYIENYESESLEISGCYGEKLEISPDQINLIMKDININSCQIEKVIVNSEFEKKRKTQDLDILTSSFSIDNSKIDHFELHKYTGDEIIIRESHFERLILKKIICEKKFILKDSIFTKIDLASSFFGGNIITDLNKIGINKVKDYLTNPEGKITLDNIESLYRISRTIDDRRFELKLFEIKNNIRNKHRKFGIIKIINILIGQSTGHFTNLWKVILTSMLTIIVLACVYHLYNLLLITDPNNITVLSIVNNFDELLNQLYFSFNSFFSLSQDNDTPYIYIKIISSFEGLIGIYLSTAFVLILARIYS